jgi:tetratricopeptide (TPR) repeat protein
MPREHPQEHPDPQLLEKFMRNELELPARRRIVRHMLAGCAHCLEVTRRLWALGEQRLDAPLEPLPEAGGLPPSSYQAAFERMVDVGRRHEQRIAVERAEAPRLLAELLRHPGPRRLGLLCGDERFQTIACGELLAGRCREAAPRDPELALEMGELAVAVAEQLDRRLAGAAVVQSLRLRSWARFAHARRCAGDRAGAERAFAMAESLRDRGAGDALDEAELLALEAGLYGAAGKLDEARRLLERAAALYERAGERPLLGRTLVQKGMLCAWAGQQEAAIDLLRRGVEAIAESAEPRLLATALHGLAALLGGAGRGEEGLQVLARAREICRELQDRRELLRLRRLEGKIEEALGRPEAAEAALVEARDGLLGEALGWESGLALLDLAILYERQGRRSALRALAEAVQPILRAPDVRQPAAAALLVFRRLVETGHVTLEFLLEMSRFLAGSLRSRQPEAHWGLEPFEGVPAPGRDEAATPRRPWPEPQAPPMEVVD